MKTQKYSLVLLSALVILTNPISVSADGEADIRSESVQADVMSDNSIMNEISAKAAILVETSTGTVIAEKNSDEKMCAGHLAKLMTLLIAEEKIDKGKLQTDENVTASVNANSKGAPQIWLDVGESISVDELIKSITIGNANDGCTALAEKISGTEQDFIKSMNKKARNIGMKNTYFSDCTGISEDTVSTAYDLSLLSAEVLKYERVIPYLTTWMTNVRNNTVELVSTNRLIRTYKGITGLKSCASKESGACLVATATRGNMSLCAVVLGCSDEDSKFSDAKALLNYGFENYGIYEPEIEKEAVEKIKVKGGEKLESEVKTDSLTNIVIPRGAYPQISCQFERENIVEAPAPKNTKIGKIVFKSGEDIILEGEIVLKDEVRKNSFLFSFKRILLKLFN